MSCARHCHSLPSPCHYMRRLPLAVHPTHPGCCRCPTRKHQAKNVVSAILCKRCMPYGRSPPSTPTRDAQKLEKQKEHTCMSRGRVSGFCFFYTPCHSTAAHAPFRSFHAWERSAEPCSRQPPQTRPKIAPADNAQKMASVTMLYRCVHRAATVSTTAFGQTFTRNAVWANEISSDGGLQCK